MIRFFMPSQQIIMKSLIGILVVLCVTSAVRSTSSQKNDYGLKSCTRQTESALLSKGRLVQYSISGIVGTVDAKVFYFRNDEDYKPIELTKSPSGIVAAPYSAQPYLGGCPLFSEVGKSHRHGV